MDLGWKVVLSVETDTEPSAQNTLQQCRAQLILYYKIRTVFLRTLVRVQEQDMSYWAEEEVYVRYLEPSLKGCVEVD